MMMFNSPILFRYKLHHLLFWLFVFAAWYGLRYEDYTLQSTAIKVTLVKVIDLALMIYVTNYILLPKLFYRKKYLLFTVSFMLMILVSSYVKMQLLGHIMNAPAFFDLSGNIKTRFYDNVLPHFFLVIAGAAVKLMFDYSALQKTMAETAKEKAEAELNFLKAQINPHFLFNSLNSVYFLIDKQNQSARNALHKFSDMLRFQLYETTDNLVPIEKELTYLRDYIDLQCLRKDEDFEVKFNFSTELQGFSLEPLLLITFIENAFKHAGSVEGAQPYIHIDLNKTSGGMELQVLNSKAGTRATARDGGIGMTNVKRRLDLLYPGRYNLDIEDQEHVHKIKLSLTLNS